MPNSTIHRKDYRPYPFKLQQVYLEFDLYDDEARVQSQMVFERENPGPLHLYGDELELIQLKMGDEMLSEGDYELKDGDLYIHDCPDAFTLHIETRIRPQDNTELSGLYRTNHLFCTQCEAQGFRRIMFFPDRPDVLSVFTTKIIADKEKYPVLLSNGNLIEVGSHGEQRHWALWQDPFKKPAYLFALVAGDLACVQDTFKTASGRTVDLRIYVEPGNEDKCQHAMESLKRAMRWDEEKYGREYDLDIFMIVAVSDFNMGAMENKGLNIFNSKYILARPDTATDSDYLDIEGVVGHEYFHNWTGNRVTCRDWFQLSLKEGLTVFRDQEFSRDMNSREVNRILDVKMLRNAQFPEDAGAMAHPVRPESYQEINNFYTATVYNKGAEVIRMQHTLLGDEGFRRGMDLYFKRHDGQAVTIDDFVAAMEDANEVDLTQFKLWYSQAGTPEVKVKSSYDAGTLRLQIDQTCRPTPESQEKKPFHIPIRVALFDSNGQALPLQTDVLELKEASQVFEFEGLNEKPLVSLLRDFSAPVTLHDERNETELTDLLRYESNGVAKWDAAQRLTINCLTKHYQDEKSSWMLPESLLNAYQHLLLDESLDPALKAEVISPPGFEDIATHLTLVNVSLLESVRDDYRATLGRHLFDKAERLYQVLWQQEEHAMESNAYGRRKLRNLCLWLMMKADEKEALNLCQEQFTKARTMTDQIASFNLLVNCTFDDYRLQAIEAFYQQWKTNDLVLDKWFTALALCELPGTLTEVRQLMSHSAFNIKNPNKVRALLGAFCSSNYRHFHAEDGSGYAFLSEVLLTLDKYNPQVAARLATPFTRWQRLDKPRQALMQEELQTLAKNKLSRDLQELVSKSLI
ncbi:aminopeptidase N [Legionella impletisoli]|uniref:Aminopeptidase N n=1 Tax=Legionella impletisoli TaxID=343510 RepID=A0A917NAT2_9GAMM|nr:aminopeptidase N [Legionella impletisoli]GGI84384.1 aminopeptidase N [Legionella impletisoli]